MENFFPYFIASSSVSKVPPIWYCSLLYTFTHARCLTYAIMRSSSYSSTAYPYLVCVLTTSDFPSCVSIATTIGHSSAAFRSNARILAGRPSRVITGAPALAASKSKGLNLYSISISLLDK